MRLWRLRRSLWIEDVCCIQNHETMHLVSEFGVDMIFPYISNVIVTVHNDHLQSQQPDT